MIEQLPGYGPPTPVPIFQWEAEFESCLELFRRFEPHSVLEIGTYHGGTLYHWMQNATWLPIKVVSVDSYAAGVDNRALYEEWRPAHVSLCVIEGDSRNPETIAAAEEHGPYDWVFIDAGHYDHEVRADWKNYLPMAAPGGTVLFHDILPPTQAHPEIEVSYLWEEIRRGYRTLEFVQNWHAEWGGIGAVLL